MHDPRVDLIVWGPHSPPALLEAVRSTIASLAGSAYANILTQYSDTHGPIHNDIRLQGAWIDPVSAPARDLPGNVAGEIRRAQTENHWAADANTLFMLLLPPGIDGGGCGWHGSSNAQTPPYASEPPIYAVAPYAGSPGCPPFPGQLGDDLSFATYVVVHELAEAITDPYLTAWNGFPSPGVNTVIGEIADACSLLPGDNLSLHDGTAAWVPQLYSETAHGCRGPS
jgi:hypothetical protein